MNRGGLAGSAWELDDRFTAYDAEGVAAAGLDGSKLLLRVDLADPATAATMSGAAAAVAAMARRRLPVMVEPLPVSRGADGKLAVSKDEDALIRALADRRIGSAALDVTAIEPLPKDSPLWTFANVLISPHSAGCGKDGSERFNAIFAENLRRYQAGEPLIGVVDWEKIADGVL